MLSLPHGPALSDVTRLLAGDRRSVWSLPSDVDSRATYLLTGHTKKTKVSKLGKNRVLGTMVPYEQPIVNATDRGIRVLFSEALSHHEAVSDF